MPGMITRIELQEYRRTTDHHRRSPEAQAFRRRLEEALAALPPTERQVIFMHYCLRLGWVAVALRLNYSESQVKRIHKKACKLLAES